MTGFTVSLAVMFCHVSTFLKFKRVLVAFIFLRLKIKKYDMCKWLKSTLNFFFSADHPKDLASELVHHAFISEVSSRSSKHQASPCILVTFSR